MTTSEFRRLALSFPETEEKAHMGHPDFRVRNKIFATLAWPDATVAMVKLTPDQQHEFVHDSPKIFLPVKGGWGRKGATHVQLKAATKKVVMPALEAAWRNTAPRKMIEQYDARDSSNS